MVKGFRDDHQLSSQECKSVSQSPHWAGRQGFWEGKGRPCKQCFSKRLGVQVLREWVSTREGGITLTQDL